MHPGVAQLRHPRIMLDEADRGRQVEHEPAETAVVKVDHLDVIAVDEQVGEPDIGVDQAEPVRAATIAAEPPPHERRGPGESVQFPGAYADAVLPSAPA